MVKKNILIVEDSLTQAEKLRFTLESNEYIVRHEINGPNALNSIHEYSPDLIISEIVMPEMDGYSFCSAVKNDDRFKSIPVILLTFLSDPGEVIRGLESGADGFLIKPYTEEFLLSRIEYFVQNAEFRKGQEDSSVLEILFAKQKYTINSSPQQILDILFSTYEYSTQKNLELDESNKELKQALGNLTRLNANLENEVRIRTLDLENANIKLLEEIEERKQARIELMDARDRADENNRLKIALLNNMSHEIRTPMNAIMGFANLLPESDKEEIVLYSGIIQKSSNHLLKLLDDVILLARLQSEKMPLYNYDCIPSEIVEYVYQNFKDTNSEKELDFKINIPKKYNNLIIKADVDKITQILINLTSNAFKYTFKGSVEIGFDVNDNLIEFFVKDSGIGISKNEQDKIFETFYRGDQAISLVIRGNGLGLNITRELAELMGGTITIDSEVGRGSHFVFAIPFINIEKTELSDTPAESVQIQISDLEILIAEDDILNFQYLEILLKSKLGRIDHAINGAEAIEMASKNKYNLVLMDMIMPTMGGIEATKLFKQKFPHIKIIAMTAYVLPEEKDMALAAGCDGFISKPIQVPDLMVILHKYARITNDKFREKEQTV